MTNRDKNTQMGKYILYNNHICNMSDTIKYI